MKKSDIYYLAKTIEEIDIILEYVNGMTPMELEKDRKTLDAVSFRLIQMHEHMELVSKDFKETHDDIDWLNIRGFRNRLVHDYGHVDLKFVHNAVSIDIIDLKRILTGLLEES